MDKVIESVASKIANQFVVNKHISEDKESLYRYGALIAIQRGDNIEEIIVCYIFIIIVLCY